MDNTSFDRDVACAREDQASFQTIEFDTPTNINIENDENPIKKEIRKRIESSEGLFNISIKSQVIKEENEEIYSMKRYKLRGVVCILNIEVFNKLIKRLGSEMDVKNIKNLFEKLEYKIIEIKEKTKTEIGNKIKKIKDDMDLKEASNFIMFLMSHGKDGCLIDAENTEMSIKKMFLDPFSTCEPLFNKPKLFFIQSCRGNKKHSYVANGSCEDVSIDSDESFSICEPLLNKPKMFSIKACKGNEKHSNVEDGLCEEVNENYMNFDEAIGSNGNKVVKKNFSDFFIFNSTFENYASMRLEVGTIFIRCLVLTISYMCHRHSLYTIMDYVKDIMKNLKIRHRGETLNQIATNDSNTLTKNVYFLPLTTNPPSYQDDTMKEKRRSEQQLEYEGRLFRIIRKMEVEEQKWTRYLIYPSESEYDLSEIAYFGDIEKNFRKKILEPLENPEKQLAKRLLIHTEATQDHDEVVKAIGKSAGLLVFNYYSFFFENDPEFETLLAMLRKIQPVIVHTYNDIERFFREITSEDKIIVMVVDPGKNIEPNLLDLFSLKFKIPLPDKYRRIGIMKKCFKKDQAGTNDWRSTLKHRLTSTCSLCMRCCRRSVENSDDIDWVKLSNRLEGMYVVTLRFICNTASKRAIKCRGHNSIVKMEDMDYAIRRWEKRGKEVEEEEEEKEKWYMGHRLRESPLLSTGFICQANHKTILDFLYKL